MDPALQKLLSALEEYLAVGGDTPVAAEAQALVEAISASAGEEGAAPPAPGEEMMPPGDEMGMMPPPEEGPGMDDLLGPPPPEGGFKSFDAANAGGALEELELRNKKKKTPA